MILTGPPRRPGRHLGDRLALEVDERRGSTCTGCGAAVAGGPFCPECGRIRPFPAGSDHWAVLGLERNHFDRLVHFLYGLLLTYPMHELLVRSAGVRGYWSYFLPITISLAGSLFFELVEWVAAELFGGDLGIAYLGTQGDVWDAQKDMALAALGAVLAMGATYAAVWMRDQRPASAESA